MRRIVLSQIIKDFSFGLRGNGPEVLFFLHPTNGHEPIITGPAVLSDEMMGMAARTMGSDQIDTRSADEIVCWRPKADEESDDEGHSTGSHSDAVAGIIEIALWIPARQDHGLAGSGCVGGPSPDFVIARLG